MPCKIGITRSPKERKSYVEMIYRTAKNWQILGIYEERSEAAAAQRRFTAQLGCQTVEQTEETEGEHRQPWHVFFFTHGKTPKISEYGGLKMLNTEKPLAKK